MFVMFHVPLCTADTLSVPLAKCKTNWYGTFSNWTSVKPTLTDNVPPSFVSILLNVLLPVVCNVAVAAPVVGAANVL